MRCDVVCPRLGGHGHYLEATFLASMKIGNADLTRKVQSLSSHEDCNNFAEQKKCSLFCGLSKTWQLPSKRVALLCANGVIGLDMKGKDFMKNKLSNGKKKGTPPIMSAICAEL